MALLDFLTHPTRRGARATVAAAETRGPVEMALARGGVEDALSPVRSRLALAGDHDGVAALDRLVQERGALAEALSADVSRDRLAHPVPRATFPSAEPTSEYARKRFDVDNRARKITLYQTFLGESYVSACIEAIAARIISGGWNLKPVDPKHPNEESREPLLEYLNWCNPDETFAQILHSIATDLLWAGEAYLELTWKHSQPLGRDVPYELYTVDCLSMDYVLAEDKKSVSGYIQTIDSGTPIELSTDQIIRFWFPDPRNRLRALSPIEKLMNPIVTDTYLQLYEIKRFEQGNRGDLQIDLKEGDETGAARYVKWFREKMQGVKNAHMPVITYGGAEVKTIGRGEFDVIGRRKMVRDEILGVYKVPPQAISAIEHGALGTGAMTDGLDKQFIHTGCDPVKQRIMDPLNFRIPVLGFGIDDWLIDTSYSDLRDTKEVDGIIDQQVRGGRRTINEARAEAKLDPIPGGDVAIVVAQREIVPVADLEQVHSAQTEQGATIQAQAKAAAAAVVAEPDPATPDDVQDGQDEQDADPEDRESVGEGAWGLPHPHRGHPGKHAAWGNALKRGSGSHGGTKKPARPKQPPKPKAQQPDGPDRPTRVFTPNVRASATELIADLVAREQALRLWERIAVKRVREGKRPRPWADAAIDPATLAGLNEALAAAATEAAVREAFAGRIGPHDQHTQAAAADLASFHAQRTDRLAQEIARRAQED